jgi:predicted Zn-dependent protease
MKVNRLPVPEISDDMIARDHQFWSDYSERLIGNWITYDTSINDLCDFCDKIYVTHDYSGFKGDPKFVRDEDAQKSFSKLRNAIASSIYQWRADFSEAGRANPAVKRRMDKEAEFALKQCFAFCPYSPEAVYHLMELLSRQGRWAEIQRILQTAQKLDPHSDQFNGWLAQADNSVVAQKAMAAQQALAQAQQLLAAGKTAEAEVSLDLAAQDPTAKADVMVGVAVAYVQAGQPAKGAAVVQKLVDTSPNNWELWFYLARMQALDGKAAESAAALTKAFAINSSDMVTNPAQPPVNFHAFVRQDKSFDRIRTTPEFVKLVGAEK